jgi:hypothetical protein
VWRACRLRAAPASTPTASSTVAALIAQRRCATEGSRSSASSSDVIDGWRASAAGLRPRSTILRIHDGTLVPLGASRTTPRETLAIRAMKLLPSKGRSPYSDSYRATQKLN